MSISATKELLHFIGTKEFVNECGGLFLIALHGFFSHPPLNFL